MEHPETLSPKDLGIDKHRFKARPGPGEVAIFRSTTRSRLEQPEHMTCDQIFWTNGEEALVDLVISPMSFYRGYPESDGKKREELFRDSWRVQATGFGYDVKDYTFVASNFGASDRRGRGELAYSKNSKTLSKDLVFKFEMFVLSLADAKKLHPKLDTSLVNEGKSWSWSETSFPEPDPEEDAATP